MIDYTKINSETWDSWAEDGCEYTLPISHEEYEKITADNFRLFLLLVSLFLTNGSVI